MTEIYRELDTSVEEHVRTLEEREKGGWPNSPRARPSCSKSRLPFGLKTPGSSRSINRRLQNSGSRSDSTNR